MRPAALDEEIEIPTDGVRLGGHLTLPPHAAGIVVFAHGSGSSRHSPRNQFVARQLNAAGLGTLLFDLLTAGRGAGSRTMCSTSSCSPIASARSPAGCASSRSARAWPWATSAPARARPRALCAAAEDPTVRAVVSRGGRPDLAMPFLGAVRAHAAHRRWCRHGRARAQPAGCRRHDLRALRRRRARCDPSVRGARRPRGRSRSRPRLVPPPPGCAHRRSHPGPAADDLGPWRPGVPSAILGTRCGSWMSRRKAVMRKALARR